MIPPLLLTNVSRETSREKKERVRKIKKSKLTKVELVNDDIIWINIETVEFLDEKFKRINLISGTTLSLTEESYKKFIRMWGQN